MCWKIFIAFCLLLATHLIYFLLHHNFSTRTPTLGAARIQCSEAALMTSTTTPSTYTNPEPTTTSLLTPASRRTALTSETPLKSALRGSTTPVGTVGSPPGSTHTGYIRPEPAAHFSEPSAPTQGTMSAFTGAASMTDGLPDLPDDFPLFEYPGNSTDAITMPTTAPTTAPTPTESTMSPPAHWGLPLPYHPYRAPSFADPGFTQPTPDDTRAELYTNLYNTHALISDVLAERPHARAPLDAAFFTAYETLNHTADTNLTMAALRDYTSKSSRTLSAYSQQVCETKNHSRVEDFMTGNAASCVATFDTLLNQISNGLGWMHPRLLHDAQSRLQGEFKQAQALKKYASDITAELYTMPHDPSVQDLSVLKTAWNTYNRPNLVANPSGDQTMSRLSTAQDQINQWLVDGNHQPVPFQVPNVAQPTAPTALRDYVMTTPFTQQINGTATTAWDRIRSKMSDMRANRHARQENDRLSEAWRKARTANGYTAPTHTNATNAPSWGTRPAWVPSMTPGPTSDPSPTNRGQQWTGPSTFGLNPYPAPSAPWTGPSFHPGTLSGFGSPTTSPWRGTYPTQPTIPLPSDHQAAMNALSRDYMAHLAAQAAQTSSMSSMWSGVGVPGGPSFGHGSAYPNGSGGPRFGTVY